MLTQLLGIGLPTTAAQLWLCPLSLLTTCTTETQEIETNSDGRTPFMLPDRI